MRRLLVHRPSLFGFDGDEYKSDLVEDLVKIAIANGTRLDSGFAGTTYFGGALTVAGPSEANYKAFLAGQDEWDSMTNRLVRSLSEKSGLVKRAVRSIYSDPG